MLGDSIYTNPLMLGYAWQKGWIPLSYVSLMRAIELNAVAVDNNKTAFEWGRRAAHEPQAVHNLLNPGQVIAFTPRKKQTLDDMVQRRVQFLTFVNTVRQAEGQLGADAQPLAEAVARYLFKLMAYKDEYEVARLHTDTAFQTKVNAMFEGDFTLRYHLAPPLWAEKNDHGELQKSSFGPWMRWAFKALAPLKVLRGGSLDIFGYSEERRQERGLIQEYRSAVETLLPSLTASNRDAAAAFARLPEQIRGFGHVKARHLAVARTQWAPLLAKYWETTPQPN
jgi:indolepyruvate ferredoxin oxidoreductase